VTAGGSTSGAAAPLAGRVALVTGAGRGIGAAVAERLAAAGAHVVVNDLDDGPLGEVLSRIGAASGSALGFNGSVTAANFAEQAVAACVDAFGGLDIIVNNAGYTWDGPLHKMTDEQWLAMLDVHLTAPFRILRAAYPVLKDQARRDSQMGVERRRKVVNVSSIVGLVGNAGQANYAAAKAGVQSLTRTLAKEWGRIGVNVNCVAFGHIETRLTQPRTDASATLRIDGRHIAVGVGHAVLEQLRTQIPLGRAGTAEEAAGAVCMFCGPDSDYVSGQVMVCGGGLAAF